MGKATGKGSTPASQNPIVHSPTRQHRDTLTGRFVHCAGDACPQCHANSNGHEPVNVHACPGGHERWIMVATDSPGRLKLYRHIQTHYDVQLAPKMFTRFGVAGVAFAAMMADAFCAGGVMVTHAPDGTGIARFAYFKSPLNDYRDSMARGDKPTLDFIADLLLSGQWRKEDLTGFVPSNIIRFDPHTNGRSPTPAA